MIQNAQILVQVIERFAGVTPRDLHMAKNVEWILDHAPAGSKIMLSAHNSHVMRAEEPSGFRPMGMYLAERYGDRMYTMGIAYGTGLYNTFGARGLTSYETHAPVPGSLETLLEATQTPRFVINFREPDGEAPGIWFQRIRFLRFLGNVAVRCGFQPIVAAEAYHGLIWIDQTNPSALLPFD
jgi:erythromycin esterase